MLTYILSSQPTTMHIKLSFTKKCFISSYQVKTHSNSTSMKLRYYSYQVFVFISSQLLLVVFMFGNPTKTVFEAIIIFVFVMHPFDVGDRYVIDGIQMFQKMVGCNFHHTGTT